MHEAPPASDCFFNIDRWSFTSHFAEQQVQRVSTFGVVEFSINNKGETLFGSNIYKLIVNKQDTNG